MPFNKGDFTQQGVAGDVSALVRLNEKRVMKVVLSSDDESDNCDISGAVTDLLNNEVYPIGAGVSGNIEITENGENINVAPYATATVNVAGGGGDTEIVLFEGQLQSETQQGGYYLTSTTGALPTFEGGNISLEYDGNIYTLEYDSDLSRYTNNELGIIVDYINNILSIGLPDNNVHTVKGFVNAKQGILTLTCTNLNSNGYTDMINFNFKANEPVNVPVTLLNGYAEVRLATDIASITDNVNCYANTDSNIIILSDTPASVTITLQDIS